MADKKQGTTRNLGSAETGPIEEGIHTRAVGPDLGLDLPSADPTVALEEIIRRRGIAQNPGPDVALPDEVVLAKRAIFERENGGFWICNFANEKFSTQCMCPNIRVVSYHKTQIEANRRVMELMRDPRVTSVPAVVPANKPFLIPYSEKAAMDPRHTLGKLARNSNRYVEFVRFRDEEFKRHIEEQTPGETGLSEYHRRKTYLLRQRLREHKRGSTDAGVSALTESDAKAIDSLMAVDVSLPAFGGTTGGRGVADPSKGSEAAAAMRQAAAQSSSALETAMSRIKESKRAFDDLPEAGVDGPQRADAGPLQDVGVAGPESEEAPVLSSTPTAPTDDPALSAFRSKTTAPGPIWQGELPEHWKPESGRSKTADDWPRDLESRHGKYVCMAFVDDLDKPTDDPAYKEAAGMEPMVVLFGGEWEELDRAKDYITQEIAPWCRDLALDVVDMYEWLWPTEVDPDKLNEEHRTQHTGFTKELNTMMKQRKKTMSQTAEARAQSAALGIPLQETNVNSLPEVEEVVEARRSGMFLQGDVKQLDADGRRINDGRKKSGPASELPDVS